MTSRDVYLCHVTPSSPTHKTLGERIVWARKRHGISQERLAEMIGTSRRHMIRIEKDQHIPGGQFLLRIAEATEQDESFFKDEQADDDSEAARMPSLSIDELLRLRISEIVAEQLGVAVTT